MALYNQIEEAALNANWLQPLIDFLVILSELESNVDGKLEIITDFIRGKNGRRKKGLSLRIQLTFPVSASASDINMIFDSNADILRALGVKLSLQEIDNFERDEVELLADGQTPDTLGIAMDLFLPEVSDISFLADLNPVKVKEMTRTVYTIE